MAAAAGATVGENLHGGRQLKPTSAMEAEKKKARVKEELKRRCKEDHKHSIPALVAPLNLPIDGLDDTTEQDMFFLNDHLFAIQMKEENNDDDEESDEDEDEEED